MNYIENIFVCIVAPLFVVVFCLRGKSRRTMLFLLAGMVMCLLSAYVSTFFAALYEVDALIASLEISPLVEEVMKLLPVLFYIMVFDADAEASANAAMVTAAGFATFENVCYLTQNGADDLFDLTVRGFGTGAMHIVCGSIAALAITFLWKRRWIRSAGTLALLALASAYHGSYNILVSQTGVAAYIGYAIPLVSAVVLFAVISHRRNYPRQRDNYEVESKKS